MIAFHSDKMYAKQDGWVFVLTCDCVQVGGRAKYVPDVDGFVLGTVSAGLVRTTFKCSWSNLDFRGVD